MTVKYFSCTYQVIPVARDFYLNLLTEESAIKNKKLKKNYINKLLRSVIDLFRKLVGKNPNDSRVAISDVEIN